MANQLSQNFQRLTFHVAMSLLFTAGMSVAHAADTQTGDANTVKTVSEAPKTVSAKTDDAKPADVNPPVDNSANIAPANDVEMKIGAGAEVELADDIADAPVYDPLETFNRHTFLFNDALDRNILQPIARFYNKIMPKPLNQGVHNFFLNLNTFSTIIDDFLQFNFYQMTNDMWRMGINSTIGIGGLFDIATRMNLKYYENDFGMTLHTWGWRNSNYLVLPFYGSYTVRDGFSLPFDFFLFSAYQFIEPPKLRYGLYALSVVDWRASTMKYNDLMDAAALDKYVFVRNAYLQRRAYQLDENEHLGIKDRDAAFAGVNAEDSSTGPGAGSNIDESANVGQPANTDDMRTAKSFNGHVAKPEPSQPAAVSKS